MNVTDDKSCGYCGRKGHNEVQCWKKHPELSPKPKGNGDGSNSNSYYKKKKGPCWICGGPHQKKECPKYKGNEEGGNNEDSINGLFMGVIMITEDVCAVCADNEDQEGRDVFIGAIECAKMNLSLKSKRFLADSGSMTHTICDESIELENEVITNDKVQGFNGSAVYIKSKGYLKVKDTSTDCVVELKKARKSNAIKKNIVSIGQLQNEGWTLRGHDSILVMEKETSCFVS